MYLFPVLVKWLHSVDKGPYEMTYVGQISSQYINFISWWPGHMTTLLVLFQNQVCLLHILSPVAHGCFVTFAKKGLAQRKRPRAASRKTLDLSIIDSLWAEAKGHVTYFSVKRRMFAPSTTPTHPRPTSPHLTLFKSSEQKRESCGEESGLRRRGICSALGLARWGTSIISS